MTPRLVGIHSRVSETAAQNIWPAFERLVSVRFCLSPDSSEFSRADAYILLEPDQDFLTGPAAGKPCFVFNSSTETVACPSPGSVSFACAPLLDRRLRGRVISHKTIPRLPYLPDSEEHTILARYCEQPVWARQSRNNVSTDLLSLPLPELRAGEFPFDYLDGLQFIQLLPLLHFLREVDGSAAWQPPVLRACIMFDDPNLHWSTYGFFPFDDITRLAEHSNFHVACATVPLDGWFVHRGTAEIFRRNPRRLSLLIHGNDHLREELGQIPTEADATRLLAQALRRIDQLDRRSGIRTSRVMAPPHEACRPHTFRAMSALGFSSACISPWSLRYWDPERKWPASFGLEMTELMEARFPVAPRFKMEHSCEGLIVVSAFLNRPIVPVGHHNTLADGLDIIEKVAGTINSLGNVVWTDMESIARSSYYTHQQGSTLRVRSYSSNFTITPPEDVTSLVIDKSDREMPDFVWHISESNGRVDVNTAEGCEIPVAPGTTIDVRLSSWGTSNYRSLPAPARSVWAPARRGLCEARDRLLPYLRRKPGST